MWFVEHWKIITEEKDVFIKIQILTLLFQADNLH